MTMTQARQLSRPVRRIDDEPELFTPPPKPPVRKLEKAPHAFRTISEVGEELNVPQHVLRFWETRFTQLRPLKRGGGRRYYRSEDVTLLRQIHSLLYSQGYTIKGAQKVLKDKPSSEREIVSVARPVPVDNSGEEAAILVVSPVSDDSRALLVEMLNELKALRALV